MDLGVLIPEDRAKMQVRHPVTGADLPVEIYLYGIDSEQYHRSQRAVIDAKLARKGRDAARDLEDGLGLLADCTAGWKGVVLNGEELEHSRENAIELYRQLKWLREQVDQFIGDRSRFIRA